MKYINQLFSQFNNNTPGCFIVVSRNQKVIFEKSIGLANIERNTPIISQTAFRLASLTKPFTAMAIMILKERKQLNFDDNLGKFFPDFPTYSKEITVRQLLTHTSGVPDHEQPLYKKIKPGEEPTIYDSLEVLKQEDKLLFPAGSRYVYSDAGYVVLALIIEKLTEQSYSQFLDRNIFKPLSLENTIVMDKTKPFIKNRAYGYKKNKLGYELFDYDPLNFIIGDEGIYSTAVDLIKWRRAWVDNILVEKDTLREALIPQVLSSSSVGKCGFSWFLRQVGKRDIIFHDGFWVGFNNIMLTEIKTETTVIILANVNCMSKENDRLNLALELVELLD